MGGVANKRGEEKDVENDLEKQKKSSRRVGKGIEKLKRVELRVLKVYKRN